MNLFETLRWELRRTRGRTGTKVYRANVRRHVVPFLLLAPWAWADGIVDSAGYAPVTLSAAEIDEAIYVVIIDLADLPADWHTAQAAASDTTGATIRVSSDDNATEFPIHVIDIDTGADDGVIAARISTMSASSDVTVHVHVGAAVSMYAVTDTYGRNAVWADFAAVYTLTGSGGLTDATGTNGTLTNLNTATAGVAGPGRGLTGYGVVATSSQGLYLDDAPLTGLPVTMLTFFEANDAATAYVASAIASSASNTTNRVMQLSVSGTVTGDPVQAFVHGGGGSNSNASSSSGFTANTWAMAGGSRNSLTSGTTTATINGGSAGTNTGDLTAFGTPNRFAIGFRRALANQAFHDGTVGLTLIENSVLSVNWQTTFYRMVTDADFYSVGTWVPAASGGGMTVRERTRGFFGLVP